VTDQRYDPAHPAARALLEVPASELAARRGELQAAASAAGLSPDDIAEVLNSRPELPRPLLAEERVTLLALLNHADFEGRAALLEQVESAHVTAYCGCGCATVSLAVEPSAQSAGKTYRPIPNEANILDTEGKDIGDVMIFADDGFLSNLEVVWHEEPISPFPPLDRLRLWSHNP
jgi:hypothetical protein